MGKHNYKLFFRAYNLAGVTLIELLIVIAVVAIIAGTMLTLINPIKYIQRGRDTQRKADIAMIKQAIELYRSDVGQYPTTAKLSSCGASTSLTAVVNSQTVKYLSKIPCDPKAGNVYEYSTPDGSTYTIRACLENTSDTSDGVLGSCTNGYTGIYYTQTNP